MSLLEVKSFAVLAAINLQPAFAGGTQRHRRSSSSESEQENRHSRYVRIVFAIPGQPANRAYELIN
jgi:hypothetical protein